MWGSGSCSGSALGTIGVLLGVIVNEGVIVFVCDGVGSWGIVAVAVDVFVGVVR